MLAAPSSAPETSAPRTAAPRPDPETGSVATLASIRRSRSPAEPLNRRHAAAAASRSSPTRISTTPAFKPAFAGVASSAITAPAVLSAETSARTTEAGGPALLSGTAGFELRAGREKSIAGAIGEARRDGKHHGQHQRPRSGARRSRVASERSVTSHALFVPEGVLGVSGFRRRAGRDPDAAGRGLSNHRGHCHVRGFARLRHIRCQH